MSPYLEQGGDTPASLNNSVRRCDDDDDNSDILPRPASTTAKAPRLLSKFSSALVKDGVAAGPSTSDPEKKSVKKKGDIVCKASSLGIGTFYVASFSLQDNEDEKEKGYKSENNGSWSDDEETVRVAFHLHSDLPHRNNKVEQEKLQMVTKDETEVEEQCSSVDTSLTDISTTSWSIRSSTTNCTSPTRQQKHCQNLEVLKPSLYMRVTDLHRSLQLSHTNDCTEQRECHEHCIRPQSIPNLDDDSSEYFIALNFIVHDDNDMKKCNQESKHEKDYSTTSTTITTMNPCPTSASPMMKGIIEILTEQSLEFACNPDYWIFYQQSLSSSSSSLNYSSILPSLPSSPSSMMQFPQIKNTQSNATIRLSKEQIQLLKKEVLLWSNKTSLPKLHPSSSPSSFHNIYTKNNDKHNLVAIRSLGVIENKRPKEIYDLLLDSKRVKEYNQYAIGREDIWMYDHSDDDQDDDDTVNDASSRSGHKKSMVTKVCRGQNKTIRKFSYMTFFHGEELQPSLPSFNSSPSLPKQGEGNGYMLISRSVKQVDTNGVVKDAKLYNTEIMLGCTLFLSVQCTDDVSMDCSNLTFFVNANYAKSPMPCYVTRKVALSAAGSFFNCLRSC